MKQVSEFKFKITIVFFLIVLFPAILKANKKGWFENSCYEISHQITGEGRILKANQSTNLGNRKTLSKRSNLSLYCSFVGMYIFAQDLNEQYLGFITDNQFHSESIINEFGTYGSEFSSKSINNKFSTYGSEFSSYSAYNKYSTKPPVIYSYNSVTDKHKAEAYLTKNISLSPRMDPDILQIGLKEGCSYVPPEKIKDLKVDSLKCSYFDDSLRIEFQALNNGDYDISKSFFIDVTNNDSIIKGWNSNEVLKVNHFYQIKYSHKAYTRTNEIKAIVDSENNISEKYEFNNSKICNILADINDDTIDVIIDSLKVFFEDDTLWTFFIVSNMGNSKLPAGMNVSLYENDSLMLLYDPNKIEVPPGYYLGPYYYYNENSISGKMKIKVCADHKNIVKELDEGNNCLGSSITIKRSSINFKTINKDIIIKIRHEIISIEFSVDNDAKVSIELINIAGNKTIELFQGIGKKGINKFHYSLKESLLSGIYLIRLKSEKFSVAKRIVIF